MKFGNPFVFEEWLYRSLLNSKNFHSFVRRVYNRVNGIKNEPITFSKPQAQDFLYKPTNYQKFIAFKKLFIQDVKSSMGISTKHNNFKN
ncbi:hypothetical protein TPHA_0P01640 [Tetrapisispora phaffii CBS 4417]|uniref:Uncharacterized protein n=1 Tax=Tetrapisispora phaffii (strain ATCC 24235 / CBS 4417 / NBRC 1672 / NRRL Y-8282 / UCD 70-5) TaxID=1071381 RepID=G8C2E4_TETPH|nr:hypothetical protein TPHA_0P01640 [Tetrapisispora phaffii CBS 4417]CCE66322.1 hypothetical protein TPHA_0P01640 [Tetrapisispora phaffii CBS 4417]